MRHLTTLLVILSLVSLTLMPVRSAVPYAHAAAVGHQSHAGQVSAADRHAAHHAAAHHGAAPHGAAVEHGAQHPDRAADASADGSCCASWCGAAAPAAEVAALDGVPDHGSVHPPVDVTGVSRVLPPPLHPPRA